MYRSGHTLAVSIHTTPQTAVKIGNDSTRLEGKGYFVWQAEQVFMRMGTQDVNGVVRAAVNAGIRHIIIKIADGKTPFPIPATDPDGSKEKLTAEMINALRRAGITVWGWAFVYGQQISPQSQAHTLAQRARQFQVKGLVINAEDYGERKWSATGGAARAQQYVAALRQEMMDLPDCVLAFSSYHVPSRQPDFPFVPFLDACDIVMPHVYWVAGGEGNAIAELQSSYQEYKHLCPEKQFIPVGAAYGQITGARGSRYFWSASPRQIKRFMDQAQALGMPAVTFWSWEHAIRDPANQRYNGTELWDAIATYRYGINVSGGTEAQPETTLEIGVDQSGYYDGVYTQYLAATLAPYTWQEMTHKYAHSVANTPSSVWALWRPDIPTAGFYDISVWIPGRNATTHQARYQIHGIVGENRPLAVEVDQNRFSDTWVSLGVYELDANNPFSGQVNLTNYTDETDRLVGFSRVRWQQTDSPGLPQSRLADGFDVPIGTEEERRSNGIWPGGWIDANSFGNYYRLRGGYAFHTGADLNLNTPAWDHDRGKPVYAVASGEVTFAGYLLYWGNVVVVRHDPLQAGGSIVYSRSAHLASMMVRRGQRVQRGQQVGTIGQDDQGGPFHLHFDISPTEVLYYKPGDWPGLDRNRLLRDYVDPQAYLHAHRPHRR